LTGSEPTLKTYIIRLCRHQEEHDCATNESRTANSNETRSDYIWVIPPTLILQFGPRESIVKVYFGLGKGKSCILGDIYRTDVASHEERGEDVGGGYWNHDHESGEVKESLFAPGWLFWSFLVVKTKFAIVLL